MSEPLSRLREIVGTLRSPEGCPWDREQTHESLRGALLEECYEAIEAINLADDANLTEELGDLLLLVIMHAQIGEERGAFQFGEIVHGVCEKLIRRHPHVFGDKTAEDSTAVLKQWEQIKRGEKGAKASLMDGLIQALPALMRAQNAQKKAARVGFDWGDTDGVFAKIGEEISEIHQAVQQGSLRQVEEEIGDLLFTIVNLSRKLGVDAESCLASSTKKFASRFREMESLAESQGRKLEDLNLQELDAIWDEVKSKHHV